MKFQILSSFNDNIWATENMLMLFFDLLSIKSVKTEFL